MLLIPCPYCGPRDEIEFRCGGQSHLVRPEPPEAVSDRAWAEYLFFRANRQGENLERWVHWAGCRQWFNLARDTVTHEIRLAYPIGGATPSAGCGEPR